MQESKTPSNATKRETISDTEKHPREDSHEKKLRRLGMALRSIGGACQQTDCIGAI
jgi:hypothetical protein